MKIMMGLVVRCLQLQSVSSASPRHGVFLVHTNPSTQGGDQADQTAAEDHRATDASTVLQLFRHADESVVRRASKSLYVKLYHCEVEFLQSLLRAAGAPPLACNLVPQVVQ